MNRRKFLLGALAGTALGSVPGRLFAAAAPEYSAIVLDPDPMSYSAAYAMLYYVGGEIKLFEHGRHVKTVRAVEGGKISLVYDGSRMNYLVDDRPVYGPFLGNPDPA